jgi:3-oxoacyl-[acyl-carrier protein] reductase
MDAKPLAGKTAVVTGAARGLGRSYALRLAELGASVAIVDKDLTSYNEFEAEKAAMTAASTVEEITNLGGRSLGFELDVTDRGALVDMTEAVVGEWGRLDILIANAGGGSGSWATTLASALDADEFDLIVKRNLYGTVNSANAVAPYMRNQNSGKIITVSSILGSATTPIGGYAHYGSAKAAVVMYTRYLAKDLGPHGITVNCIAPGVIVTGRIAANVTGDANPPSDIPLRRYGTTEDVTNVVEFLAGSGSDYITGAVIPIDGGLGGSV